VRPTQLQVMDGYRDYLAATGRHSVTSRELASARGWSLMEVSAALNHANQRGALVREGGAFRPAVSQVGATINKASALVPAEVTVAAVKGNRWPPDSEFAERYTDAIARPEGPKVALEREFRRPYNTISGHARQVFERLGVDKPSVRGAKPRLDDVPAGRVLPKHEWPSDQEFCRRYEAALASPKDVRGAVGREFNCTYTTANKRALEVYRRLGLPKPNGRRGPAPVVDPVAYAVAATHRLSADELEQFFGDEPQRPVEPPDATERTNAPERVSVALSEVQGGKVEGLDEEANEAGESWWSLSAKLDAVTAENARLQERLATTHRTIQSLNARLEQAETRPQQITLTLTLPMDALRVSS